LSLCCWLPLTGSQQARGGPAAAGTAIALRASLTGRFERRDNEELEDDFNPIEKLQALGVAAGASRGCCCLSVCWCLLLASDRKLPSAAEP
jgi:hypothetical protein